MSLYRVVAVVIGAVLEGRIVEPPVSVHPVAWLGEVVSPLDRVWRSPGLAGAAIAVLVPIGVAIPVAAPVDASALVSPWLATGGAAVESVAENLTDGLVAPSLAFTLGAALGLPVAVGASVWVKAVNALDSMLGSESNPHGTASARLDDLLLWLPARVSAVLVAVASGGMAAPQGGRRWARNPPSPNSGWPMATMAVLLGVRLEKPGVYVRNKIASLPNTDAANHGIVVAARAGWLAYGLAVMGVRGWS